MRPVEIGRTTWAAALAGMRARIGLLLLMAFTLTLAACRLKCEDVALGTPVADFRTEPAGPGSFPSPVKGPAAEVLCCQHFQCLNAPSCDCGVDCTQPLYRDGGVLGLTDSLETYEGYPELSNEYAICEVWNFESRVAAVWWAPQY